MPAIQLICQPSQTGRQGIGCCQRNSLEQADAKSDYQVNEIVGDSRSRPGHGVTPLTSMFCKLHSSTRLGGPVNSENDFHRFTSFSPIHTRLGAGLDGPDKVGQLAAMAYMGNLRRGAWIPPLPP